MSRRPCNLGGIPHTPPTLVVAAMLNHVRLFGDASAFDFGAYASMNAGNQAELQDFMKFRGLLFDLARAQPELRFKPVVLRDCVMSVISEAQALKIKLNMSSWPDKQFANMVGCRIGVLVAHLRRFL